MAGNQNSGRRPKPTALKVLKGVRSDRINHNEPQPKPGEPVKPESLSGWAGKVWDRLAPVVLAMDVLTVADGDAFATLCELIATRELVSQEKSRPSFQAFISWLDKSGQPHVRQHPAIVLERATASALRPYFEKFGLDPQGRARLTVGPAKDQGKSKWTGLIA